MEYLLIAFVVMVALAPLSLFVPSRRQRQVARMREYAAVHGLFVEFRRLPGSRPSREQRDSPALQEMIYYGKRFPVADGAAPRRCSWVVDEGRWRALDRRQEVPAPLLELPSEVLAASVDEGSCGVYWRESGSEEEVAAIVGILESWGADLCA